MATAPGILTRVGTRPYANIFAHGRDSYPRGCLLKRSRFRVEVVGLSPAGPGHNARRPLRGGLSATSLSHPVYAPILIA
jgi:hypothetical protein